MSGHGSNVDKLNYSSLDKAPELESHRWIQVTTFGYVCELSLTLLGGIQKVYSWSFPPHRLVYQINFVTKFQKVMKRGLFYSWLDFYLLIYWFFFFFFFFFFEGVEIKVFGFPRAGCIGKFISGLVWFLWIIHEGWYAIEQCQIYPCERIQVKQFNPSWGWDKVVHASPNCVSPKSNVIARLDMDFFS